MGLVNRARHRQMTIPFINQPLENQLPAKTLSQVHKLISQLMVQVLTDDRQQKETRHEPEDSTEPS